MDASLVQGVSLSAFVICTPKWTDHRRLYGATRTTFGMLRSSGSQDIDCLHTDFMASHRSSTPIQSSLHSIHDTSVFQSEGCRLSSYKLYSWSYEPCLLASQSFIYPVSPLSKHDDHPGSIKGFPSPPSNTFNHSKTSRNSQLRTSSLLPSRPC